MLAEGQQDPSEVVLLRRFLQDCSLFLIKGILIWAEASEALSAPPVGSPHTRLPSWASFSLALSEADTFRRRRRRQPFGWALLSGEQARMGLRLQLGLTRLKSCALLRCSHRASPAGGPLPLAAARSLLPSAAALGHREEVHGGL